ncbi:tryptophan-rich sensory protein [Candidatus Gottesmanbacteria bacterium]|nr:tryptophan-rich sensory protein [Candidatus Gottesmanbacteria bacterium]
MRVKHPARLIFTILLCELVGLIATPVTINAIPVWYATLAKPFFSPPNWIFGPVWTVLYFMMGYAAYLIWERGINKNLVKTALLFFVIQLFLNSLWSFLFFGLHSPILGFIDIIVLWIFILLTILKFSKISKVAAYLLIPYFFWVSFASLLNVSIIILN